MHRYPIALAFDGNDLVLAGELEDIATKKIALEIAQRDTWCVLGVREVVNQITVKW